ncbi:MAG: hypothetical protein MJ179_00940 [Treponema sp.]|nr:hypothetical protein [Treponema sp.]
MDNENTINKELTGTLYFTNNGNGFFAPEDISNEEYDKISKEIDSKIIQLNVINRSSWTYFDSDKISTIVYDVEIPETLYKELLPHSFDNRNINENEVACIEYRKSMLTSDQDQFLISKFDRNDFTLKQQKEIQINDELKSQIRNVCDVYEKKQSYTDAILEKFEAAGIEVVTDKDEFDKILVEENIVQKMSDTPIEEEKNPLFLADENELKAFAQKVDDWKAGKLNSAEIITEFSTSTVLQAINIPANKIAITQERLEKINAPETQKIGNSYGHDIDIETIKQIPNFLADPVMVFKSATRTDSYTVMTEAMDKNNETILVALQISKNQGSIIVNEITSAYGKDENEWFIEQIKLGNLVYENKQKSLEWSHRRGLLLPTRMSTQGSLNIIQKEDIVNKRTSNFDLSERNIEFTENQQEFLKSIGFINPVDKDGNVIHSSFEKINSANKKAAIKLENMNDIIIMCSYYDSKSYYAEELDRYSEDFFIEFSDLLYLRDPSIIPVENLAKIISDNTLNRMFNGEIEDIRPEPYQNIPVSNDFLSSISNISFKNKVSNLPAKFISESIYSANLNTGKVLTYVLHDNLMESAGFNRSSNKEHFLIEIQTDNNYEKVSNKDYPRLYKAKWDRASKAYIDKTEIPLSDLDSKTLDNIQYIAENNCNTELAKTVQTMTLENGSIYGFVHNGKIYLNPEIMNSNAAVHEYTHLWDAYTQKTNPELWNKGLELFKNTKYWNEVISDPNYQNIKDNENLVLSEIHSRISGEFAEQVLNRIAELDGKEVKLDAIDWDKETWLYIQNNFFDIENNEQEVFAEFLSTPMKDLVNEKNINLNIENTQTNTNDLFKDFQFDFSEPVTWHFVDNTSLIYADTFISNEQALSLFNAAGANDSYNKDMQYCIQYRCTSTDKNNLVYLCKYDPNVEITTPLKEINLPEDIINKVMNGVETGIKEHLQQQHTIPDYLLDAVGYGDKKVVQEEVSDYSTDSNKPEGIMYLSENHNVFYAEPDLPREEYLKLSAQTDIDELKKQQSFLYTDENDDFGYQSNILEQREVYQHKIDRLQAKIDSLNGVPNPLNEIISSQLPASMTSLHSFTEEERMGQFIGMKNDFKNYATEEEIKLLDDKFKTLFVDPESSVEIKKGEEFHLLADEFESYFQDTKNKHYNVASNQYESYADVQFESDKRSVEQEPVPDFAMVTQNGLQKFTGYYIQAYSDKNDIYTLSNGSNTIELPGETIKELNKPNLNEINFHGEVYSHILDHQYNDFFKYREPNIAAYFEHNLAVMIRTQAQNPLDTFKAAKEIIKAMPKNEQKITQELVKKIAASQNKSVNDLMLDMYNKAMIERPMNEEFINVNNPRNIIPRHMTDLIYISGHKIDDNSELRIGENINKVPVKAFKLNGKKQTIYLNLEVVSASKDKNLIVMKDSKENIYELPRDKILSQYEKNSMYNRRNQSVSVKHYNDSSMER